MSSKRQILKEQTKQRIIKAASMLFLKEDFDLISTDAIAKEAKVSKGIIFHHFGSKNQLGIKAVENILQERLQIILPDSEQSPEARLKKFVEGGLRLASENPGLSKFLIQVVSRVGVDEANHIFNEACLPYFQEGTNLFSALNKPNPFLKAILLVAIFDGLGVQFFLENKEPDDKLLGDLTEEILTIFL
ncbi:MAG: TetR/AcrR family transcriptional regulator [Candidatus Hodarchaeales archaeon]|jgi:AcrR family transcriptional regulator